MSEALEQQEDQLLVAQLKTIDHGVMPERYKGAIRELAEKEEGGLIYLFLMMNDRINKLEAQVGNKLN